MRYYMLNSAYYWAMLETIAQFPDTMSLVEFNAIRDLYNMGGEL